MINPRTLLIAILALSLSLLNACGITPQAASDPIDDLGSLADANGDLEATLEIVSLGSSGTSPTAQVNRNAVHSQLNYEEIKVTYKGKIIRGVSLSPGTPGSQVLAALAPGDRVKVQGRVRSVKGVPVFSGLMIGDAVTVTAVTPPAPVVLVGGNKSLPSATVGTRVQFSNASVKISRPRDLELIALRTPDNKPLGYGMPTSRPENVNFANQTATMNFDGTVVQTSIGPMLQGTGTLSFAEIVFTLQFSLLDTEFRG